jgi:hypothetical protein
MIQQARRWRPQRQPLLIVAGGCAAVSLPLACVKQHVTTRSRGRRDVALYHPPSPHRAASMAPTRCRARAACRLGRSAPRPPGRPWQAPG